MAKRSAVVFLAFTVIIGFVSLKVLTLGNGEFAQNATQNNTMSIDIAESRGEIYDCNLKKIVNTQTGYIAACKPSVPAMNALRNLLSKTDFDAVSSRFGKGFPAAVPVPVKNIDCGDIKVISVKKRYTAGQPAAHIIGYLSSDGRGTSGIEKSFDDILAIEKGRISVSFPVDAQRRVLAGGNILVKENEYYSKQGVCLTLDIDIQRLVENCLDRCGLECGAAVVLDVNTGEIKAAASRPVIDANNLTNSLKSPDSPFINRAFTSYSVGSVFKPLVAAVALENGLSPGLTFRCDGSVSTSGVVFNCHKEEGHGVVDMRAAIMDSCNVYFINLAQKIDPVVLLSTAESMGFGGGIELAAGLTAAAGRLPAVNELDSPAAIANLAFGQGRLMASPLQIAAMMASIASGGEYRKPVLIKGIVDKNGVLTKTAGTTAPERVISARTADKLQGFLIDTVENGSGRKAKPSNTTAGGKTATAQSGWYDGSTETLHAWFAGFVPAQSPRFVIVVMKENGQSGAIDCGPIFKRIAEGIAVLYPGL